MLPHSTKDEQQLERKRHIGNDRVAIIFQEENTPFSPEMINSKLLQVYIVIQPVKVADHSAEHKSFDRYKPVKRYKVTVVSKNGVPYFVPYIRKPYVFNKDENFKKFLYAKLINAEYASLKNFHMFNEQIIKPTLAKTCKKLEKLTRDFIEPENTELANSSSITFHDGENSLTTSSFQTTVATTPSTGLKSLFNPMRKLSSKLFQNPSNSNEAVRKLSDPEAKPKAEKKRQRRYTRQAITNEDLIEGTEHSSESFTNSKSDLNEQRTHSISIDNKIDEATSVEKNKVDMSQSTYEIQASRQSSESLSEKSTKRQYSISDLTDSKLSEVRIK